MTARFKFQNVLIAARVTTVHSLNPKSTSASMRHTMSMETDATGQTLVSMSPSAPPTTTSTATCLTSGTTRMVSPVRRLHAELLLNTTSTPLTTMAFRAPQTRVSASMVAAVIAHASRHGLTTTQWQKTLPTPCAVAKLLTVAPSTPSRTEEGHLSRAKRPTCLSEGNISAAPVILRVIGQVASSNKERSTM